MNKQKTKQLREQRDAVANVAGTVLGACGGYLGVLSVTEIVPSILVGFIGVVVGASLGLLLVAAVYGFQASVLDDR